MTTYYPIEFIDSDKEDVKRIENTIMIPACVKDVGYIIIIVVVDKRDIFFICIMSVTKSIKTIFSFYGFDSTKFPKIQNSGGKNV